MHEIARLYEYSAIVTAVYDGDTITVDIDLGFGIWMKDQKIRLYGINTPEIRGVERPLGLVSKSILEQWILNQKIILKTHKDKTEKYGRWLGTILVQDEANKNTLLNINEKLVAGGYAKPYML
jgi:micrococcal nuclease